MTLSDSDKARIRAEEEQGHMSALRKKITCSMNWYLPWNRTTTLMFPATCAQYGKQTEVPFEPREGRPVYCRDCYSAVKPRR